MHPGSSNSRTPADPTAPIDRHSLTDGGLYTIYQNTQNLAVARGDHNRSFNAKKVGVQGETGVDAIAGSPFSLSGDSYQGNFKMRQQRKLTQFSGAALNYADEIRVSTQKYPPFGLR